MAYFKFEPNKYVVTKYKIKILYLSYMLTYILKFVVKVMEKSIFIHNIDVPYIGDYTVIDKRK